MLQRAPQDERAERIHQTHLLGNRDEARRRNDSMFGMRPAQQGFQPEHGPASGRDDRLEMQFLVRREGARQFPLYEALLARYFVDGAIKRDERAGPLLGGAAQCELRAAREFAACAGMLRRLGVTRMHCRPNHLLHPVRPGNVVEHRLHGRMHIVGRGVEQNGELSGADAPAQYGCWHRLAQALRDGECQFFRTERAVGETIDFEEREDNTSICGTPLQCLVEMLKHLPVIGQARHRVGFGGKLRLVLGRIESFSRALQLPKRGSETQQQRCKAYAHNEFKLIECVARARSVPGEKAGDAPRPIDDRLLRATVCGGLALERQSGQTGALRNRRCGIGIEHVFVHLRRSAPHEPMLQL